MNFFGTSVQIGTLISVGIPILSLVVSALLFVISFLSLKEVKKQNHNIANAMKGDIIEKIHRAHRELFSQIISSDNYTALFRFPEEENIDETKKNYIATFYINNTFTSFYYYKQGLVDEIYWNGLQNDIYDAFRLPFIAARWKQVRRFHSAEFQTFIDNLELKGIRYQNSSAYNHTIFSP